MLKDNPYSVIDPIYQMNTHLYQAGSLQGQVPQRWLAVTFGMP